MKSSACFILTTHLNLDAKFSLEILDLQLDFIKLRVEQVGSRTQVVPNMLKSFPIIVLVGMAQWIEYESKSFPIIESTIKN